MERLRQVVAHARDRDVMLLHRLQQRRLGAGRGAVDFVRHQQLTEYRAGNEAERLLAALVFLQHLGAQDVGGHQVGRELHALFIKPQHAAQRRCEFRLGKTRRARDDGRQAQVDHLVLTEDDLLQRCARLAQLGAGPFKVLDCLPSGVVDAGHVFHYLWCELFSAVRLPWICLSCHRMAQKRQSGTDEKRF